MIELPQAATVRLKDGRVVVAQVWAVEIDGVIHAPQEQDNGNTDDDTDAQPASLGSARAGGKADD